MVQVTGTMKQWGNSLALRIPKAVLEEAKIEIDEDVEIIADSTGIFLKKKVAPVTTVEELFANYDGDYHPSEWDTGEPVGKEVF